MKDILEKITKGKGVMSDIDELETLARDIKASSLCALGQTAPNPVLSTLHYFRDEYEAHIRDKKCPAGSCKALLSYEIIEDNCKSCGLCAKNCPVNAISGNKKEKIPFVIDPTVCVKCGVCFEKCPFEAIKK